MRRGAGLQAARRSGAGPRPSGQARAPAAGGAAGRRAAPQHAGALRRDARAHAPGRTPCRACCMVTKRGSYDCSVHFVRAARAYVVYRRRPRMQAASVDADAAAAEEDELYGDLDAASSAGAAVLAAQVAQARSGLRTRCVAACRACRACVR